MTKANAGAKKRKKTSSKSRKKKEKKVSYYRKPDDMTLNEWQIALRMQFGKESKFSLSNLGDHPLFSDFTLTNPETGNQYKIAIRSNDGSANFCSCMDFKTNRLGICKHLGYAIPKLVRKRGNRKLFRGGYQQSHSSIYLDYRRLTKSTAHVVEGNVLKRKEQYETNESLYHILGYRMAANDLRHLNQTEADLIILHETQRIKNWKDLS